MSEKTGQCMCGAVTFTARNVPDRFNACYCEMCRRWTGGRFMGVHLATDDVTLTGTDAIQTIKSSPWAERAFCGKCGSALWYKQSEGPDADHYSISAGLFDDTSDMTLSKEYFSDCATSIHQTPSTTRKYTRAETFALFAPSDEGKPE